MIKRSFFQPFFFIFFNIWLTIVVQLLVINRTNCVLFIIVFVSPQTYIISNKDLYARCQVTPPAERVTKSWWKMLGHIRSDSSPQLALSFAVDNIINMRGRVGRHQSNILKTIFCDLNKRDINLRNLDYMTELRHIASNRNVWRNLYKQY